MVWLGSLSGVVKFHTQKKGLCNFVNSWFILKSKIKIKTTTRSPFSSKAPKGRRKGALDINYGGEIMGKSRWFPKIFVSHNFCPHRTSFVWILFFKNMYFPAEACWLDTTTAIFNLVHFQCVIWTKITGSEKYRKNFRSWIIDCQWLGCCHFLAGFLLILGAWSFVLWVTGRILIRLGLLFIPPLEKIAQSDVELREFFRVFFQQSCAPNAVCPHSCNANGLKRNLKSCIWRALLRLGGTNNCWRSTCNETGKSLEDVCPMQKCIWISDGYWGGEWKSYWLSTPMLQGLQVLLLGKHCSWPNKLQ